MKVIRFINHDATCDLNHSPLTATHSEAQTWKLNINVHEAHSDGSTGYFWPQGSSIKATDPPPQKNDGTLGESRCISSGDLQITVA